MEPEHPLRNQVVLQIIFKSLEFNVRDFRNYRLVSKDWWDATLKVWRDNVWLTLPNNDGKSEEDFFQKVDLVLSDSCQLHKYPFQKYELKRWNIGQIEDGTTSGVFWNRFGPLMTHLRIRRSRVHGLTSLRQIMFQKTPNLSHLSLNDNSYDERSANMNSEEVSHELESYQIQSNLKFLQVSLYKLPLPWTEVLKYFPNIEVFEPLHLGFNSAEEPNELTEMLQATQAVRKAHGPHYLTNLSELKLVGMGEGSNFTSVPRAWLSCFRQLQFPLKKLFLDTWVNIPDYWVTESEKQLLEIHSGSLESLVYTVDIGDVPDKKSLVEFPVVAFENLTYLKLVGRMHPYLRVLEECPNLKTLLLECGGEAQLEFIDDDFTHENLEEFSIRNKEVFEGSEVERLGELMPNLKKVTLGLNNDGFTMLCRTWNETLESLTIIPFHVDEKAFLGIERREKFHHPNITDLKHLRFFEMDLFNQRKGLNNDSVRFGILSLDNLKEAHIRLSFKAREKTYRSLTTKFPNCRILKCDPGIDYR